MTCCGHSHLSSSDLSSEVKYRQNLERGVPRMTQEFLPLCDVLFNIISLASYFCDVVFDVVTVYTLYDKRHYGWFGVTLACIVSSLLISQFMSIKWYLRCCQRRILEQDSSGGGTSKERNIGILIVVHVLQVGVLWRYFKLFVPVDLRYVKQEVRDLCILRFIHAFCQAAPMLLIQLYFIWLTNSVHELTHLSIVSTALSLFSICWALASFSKHIRQQNLHKLVLTWLGVIYQFMWRLGTISSRMVTLTLYASLYQFWIFLVVGLHWLSMFLWLISPKNAFNGEKLSWTRKGISSALVAYVYVFCYVNLHETNARQKMIAFYTMMLLENTLLTVVWIKQKNTDFWYQYLAVSIVWGGFALGILFMVLYYKYFHVRRLKTSMSMSNGGTSSGTTHSCTSCQLGTCSEHLVRTGSAYFLSEYSLSTATTVASVRSKRSCHGTQTSNGGMADHNGGIVYIPGVFNCRLNPAFKRKKKKPTSFVPPPAPHVAVQTNGKSDVPFWKRNLGRASKDVSGSNGLRVDIQQKLQAKKQQQLQELRVIEEEIKQGKLKRPHPEDIGEEGTLRQPIPRAKKQPWVQPPEAPHRLFKYGVQMAPEILLAPNRLDYMGHQRRHPNARWKHGHQHPLEDPSGLYNGAEDRSAASERERQDLLYKSYRIPSDLDSQVSLPRSYTLPREFKYQRKPKLRQTLRSEHFITSTNSSDGDVDSADENDGSENMGRVSANRVHHHQQQQHHHHHHQPISRLRVHQAYRHVVGGCQHETKL